MGKHSIKRKIWNDIAKQSGPMDLGKDWWLWLLVFVIVGVLVFGG